MNATAVLNTWRCGPTVALCIAILGCGDEDGCDFDEITRDEGGIGLMDCGIAREETTEAVDRCAVSAERRGVTYRAIYEQPDGTLEAILLSDDSEHVMMRTEEAGAVSRAACGGAEVVDEDGRTYVECTDRGSWEVICM